MDPKYIAPCGMTCCDCLFAQPEVYEAARNFKEAVEKHQYDTFLKHLSKTRLSFFQDFQKMDEFMSMLNKIVSMQCVNVCSEAGRCSIPQVDEKLRGIVTEKHKCNVLTCIEDKGYEGCWDCDELDTCEKKKFFRPTYGDVPVENCRLIREKGKEAVLPRGTKYYAWQQKE